MNSRLFVVFCTTVVFVFIDLKPVESRMNLDQIREGTELLKKQCFKKVKITPEQVEEIDEEYARTGVTPNVRELKCFLECILNLMRSMKDGKLQTDYMVKLMGRILPEEYVARVQSTIKECAALEYGDDNCENAWTFCQCCYETMPEMIAVF